MGAALLPALIAPLLGSVVQSVFAPPAPKPTVIMPPQAQPGLSPQAASQIAATTKEQGQQFGSQLLNSILAKARAQGTNEKELSAIQSNFNDWFGKNSDEITKGLNLAAQHSQAQANYINTVNQNNANTQLQALQAQMQPQGFNFGRALGGLLPGLMGGMGGGGGMASPAMPSVPMISGPDTAPFDVTG